MEEFLSGMPFFKDFPQEKLSELVGRGITSFAQKIQEGVARLSACAD
jgi:hypothetical protein